MFSPPFEFGGFRVFFGWNLVYTQVEELFNSQSVSEMHFERIRNMSRATRRRFLKTSSALGASVLLAGTRASGKVFGANDRVRVAIAGLHGRGKSHIGGWLGQQNVDIAYVIDPDQRVLSSA